MCMLRNKHTCGRPIANKCQGAPCPHIFIHKYIFKNIYQLICTHTSVNIEHVNTYMCKHSIASCYAMYVIVSRVPYSLQDVYMPPNSNSTTTHCENTFKKTADITRSRRRRNLARCCAGEPQQLEARHHRSRASQRHLSGEHPRFLWQPWSSKLPQRQ